MNIDTLVESTNQFLKLAELERVAFIRKEKNKYKIVSRKGKNLVEFSSKEKAEKRLKQIEFFKHRDSNNLEKEILDLTGIDDFSYSAIMRKLNSDYKDKIQEFMKLFYQFFNEGIEKDIENLNAYSLKYTLLELNKRYQIKIDKNIVKFAATAELGNPEVVGKYLSDIVKFILTRIKPANRLSVIDKVRTKIYHLDARDIASKQLPASSSIGQSITFIKHVLFNHDEKYVRNVLNSIVRNL